ncbi:Prephenate dehydratase-domain-containing protein [Blyttiomyces helicus]|uniref:Prephenate dehydratase-domain-containing protein n=1 Tax=Blyttiomyces helicus TaxID=388810 RepID=A0A4P9WC10_9FUNG|nr:Prephenate dehydratase-domain-containing protein [Blyttiomyces helicus]|eukprot:RKO87866.1 Prephenate dehydratase-domain-containing protein [Blyttiomyces helicus]
MLGGEISFLRGALVALPGTTLDQITEIRSHPYVLDQCRTFLSTLGSVSLAQAQDTAGSAKGIKEGGLKTTAAIAGARAAELYNLTILKSGIEDDSNTVTRYVLLSTKAVVPERHLNPVTSVSLVLKNQPGAIHKATAAFALRGLNISKIESRPTSRSITVAKPWEYVIYIDVDGSTADAAVANAIANLHEFAIKVRVLGSYPRYQPPVQPLVGQYGVGLKMIPPLLYLLARAHAINFVGTT